MRKTVTLFGALVIATCLGCIAEPLPISENDPIVPTAQAPDMDVASYRADLAPTPPDVSPDLSPTTDCPVGTCVPFVPVACHWCFCDPEARCANGGCVLDCP